MGIHDCSVNPEVCIVFFYQLKIDKTVVRCCTYNIPINVYKVTITWSGFSFQNATNQNDGGWGFTPEHAEGAYSASQIFNCTLDGRWNEGKEWYARNASLKNSPGLLNFRRVDPQHALTTAIDIRHVFCFFYTFFCSFTQFYICMTIVYYEITMRSVKLD